MTCTLAAIGSLLKLLWRVAWRVAEFSYHAMIGKFGYSPSVDVTISWRGFIALTSAFSCHSLRSTLRRRRRCSYLSMMTGAGCGVRGTKAEGYQFYCHFCCRDFAICWNDIQKAASDSPGFWFREGVRKNFGAKLLNKNFFPRKLFDLQYSIT